MTKAFFTHLHAEKAMANVTVSPGRAGPVEIEIQLENADELPLTANAVTVTLGNSENGVAPVTVEAEQISNDQLAGADVCAEGRTLVARRSESRSRRTTRLTSVSPILIR